MDLMIIIEGAYQMALVDSQFDDTEKRLLKKMIGISRKLRNTLIFPGILLCIVLKKDHCYSRLRISKKMGLYNRYCKSQNAAPQSSSSYSISRV